MEPATQIRFNVYGIRALMRELGVQWVYEDFYEREWINNLTRLIDALGKWCVESGITCFDLGYTQIELCITFKHKKDAMMFKLRWHDAETA